MTDNELYNLAAGKCFELNGKSYKVVESTIEKDDEGKIININHGCCDCAFYEDKEASCYVLKGKLPECISSRRKDGKLVIFMEVAEDEK